MVDTSYTLYDRHTVQRLFDDNNTFYHGSGRKITDRINRGLDTAWNKKNVQSCMLQGILQGESIGKMATRLANSVGEQNRKAAIRNVRTMATGVQNAGRVDSYDRAKKMGIKVKKQWLAALDSRTRHWHREFDGVSVDNDKPFKNDFGEIMYLGDPSADGANIYNCRCTLIADIEGFENDLSDLSLRNTNKLGDMSYEEWKNEHESTSDPITKQDEIAERNKNDYINEYKKQRAEVEEKERQLDKLIQEREDLFDRYMDHIDDPIMAKQLEEIYNKKYDQVESFSQIVKDMKANLSGAEAKAVRHIEKNLSNYAGIPIEKVKLTGLPYESADSIYKSYVKFIDKYPELRGELAGIEFNKVYNDGYAKSHLLTGQVWVHGDYANLEEFKKLYEFDVSKKHHPEGTDYNAVVVHELGHALDGYMTKKNMCNALYNQYGIIWSSADVKKQVLDDMGYGLDYKIKRREELKNKGYTHRQINDILKKEENMFIEDHISGYATKNDNEFFAECFAEYLMSENPRQAATIFGNIINKALGR
ncbi:MAG: hypothetical protein IJ703_03380 [Eubacterium sp.]|nr:hypothetical protein [Eubacterium sp.]